jgi:hypothetical protein
MDEDVFAQVVFPGGREGGGSLFLEAVIMVGWHSCWGIVCGNVAGCSVMLYAICAGIVVRIFLLVPIATEIK